MSEAIRKSALKEANLAFKIAATLGDDQRIEVYLEGEEVKRSDVMGPREEILYDEGRVLLYQVFGNGYLEEEIRAWIDQARVEENPQGLAENIREKLELIGKQTGKTAEMISSNEIFANLSLNVIEQIETAILDYWWENEEEENGKKLARLQIEEALEGIAA
jgi:hypothetical protein